MTARSRGSKQPSRGAPPTRRRAPRGPTFIQRNKSAILIGAIGVGIIGLLGAVLLLSSASNGHTDATAADPALVQAVTSVSQTTFDAVGAGTTNNPPKSATGQPLTQNGKPEVLYMGAEYCPYCAAERWAMVVALSRFGTFSGLKTTRSSPSDVYANTPTFSFYGSTFTSDYLSFVPVEMYSNGRTASGYAKLDTPTSDELALLNAAGGSFPYLNIGGSYIVSGASFNPDVLGGMDWTGIASQLNQANSKQAQAIVGTANVLTAAICRATGNKPQSVCTSPGVQAGDALIK